MTTLREKLDALAELAKYSWIKERALGYELQKHWPAISRVLRAAEEASAELGLVYDTRLARQLREALADMDKEVGK